MEPRSKRNAKILVAGVAVVAALGGGAVAATITSGDESAHDVLPALGTTPAAATPSPTTAALVEPVADVRVARSKKLGSASKTWTDRAVRASRTAAKAVPNGAAYELSYDEDDGRWNVNVVGRGRRTTEFEINRAGKRILDRQQDDDGGDADPRRARSAKVSMAAAIRTAHSRGTGRIDDVAIERRKGVTTWKVSFENGDDDEIHVYVSASSANVVAVDRNTGDDDGDD